MGRNYLNEERTCAKTGSSAVLDDIAKGLYFLVTGERDGRFPDFVLSWEIRTFEVAKITLIIN